VKKLPEHLIGIRAYDSDDLYRHLTEELGIEMIAPHGRNRRKTQDDSSPAVAMPAAGKSSACSPVSAPTAGSLSAWIPTSKDFSTYLSFLVP